MKNVWLLALAVIVAGMASSVRADADHVNDYAYPEAKEGRTAPEQIPINATFRKTPTGDKDRIIVQTDYVRLPKKEGMKGVDNDPYDNTHLFTVISWDTTGEVDKVTVDVEGRKGIGAVYWLRVTRIGEGGPGDESGPPPELLWAEALDEQDPKSQTLVLKDKNVAPNFYSVVFDAGAGASGILYCVPDPDANNEGKVEFKLHDVEGSYNWEVPGVQNGDGTLTDQNNYQVLLSGIELGEYFTLTVTGDGGGFSRQIEFVVGKIRLDQVTFGGANHDVYHDIIQEPYTTDGPHWQYAEEPEEVVSHPVAYTRNNEAVIEDVRFYTILGGLTFEEGTATATVLGNSTNSIPLRQDGNYLVLDGPAVAIMMLPNKITYYEEFEIQWSINVTLKDEAENEHVFDYLTHDTSSNTLYVTLGDPQVDKLFHTVVDIACRGAVELDGANMQEIVEGIWGKFANPTGGNEEEYDVTTWDGRLLHYYKTEDGGENTIVDGLLHDGDGECGSWASFFGSCLLVHNIEGISIVDVLPPPWSIDDHDLVPLEGYTRFAIKNIHFGDPTYEEPEPWVYNIGDLGKSGEGLPGQNTNPPKEKFFELHVLIEVGGTYYDPSYGLTFTDNKDFTERAVDGWEVQLVLLPPVGSETRWRWRKVSTEPESEVSFIPRSLD